jgi:V/A-type H+-transporting ATPase subunit E
MRNNLLTLKEELVNKAFDIALVRLKEFGATEKYHSYLLKRIKDAVKGLGQKRLIIQVNAKDKAWLTHEIDSLSKKLSCEFKLLDETGDFIGGLKAQTLDGKLTFDGTIDNKLNELKPLLRVELAKIMFKEET